MTSRFPLAAVFLVFGLGIFIHKMMGLPFGLLSLLVCVLLLVSFSILNKPVFSTIILLAAVFCLGALHADSTLSLYKRDISAVAKYYRGKTFFIKGAVASDVQKRFSSSLRGKKTTFVLKLKEIKTKWGWKERNGDILVNVFREADISFGDILLLEGKLHEPYSFSSDSRFSYKEYLNRKGIRFLFSMGKKAKIMVLAKRDGKSFKSILFKQRESLEKMLSNNFSKNEAGILQAILLGDRAGIPKHIKTLFEHTGTAHVLAISGLHVGIVVALFFFLFKMLPLNKEGHYICPIILILYYVFLTGARPPVVRAAIMASVFLLGFVLEREANSWNSLFLAALTVLIINPMNLFNVGFQLSFSAVSSIILFFGFILDKLRDLPISLDSKVLDYIFKSFALSLSAWIGVSGLIAYYFQIITPVTIISNLVVIPFITALVALGMGFLLLGEFFPFGASLFAYCLKIVLNAMVACVYLLDKIPGAYWKIRNLSLWHLLAYYCCIFIVILILKRRKKLVHL